MNWNDCTEGFDGNRNQYPGGVAMNHEKGAMQGARRSLRLLSGLAMLGIAASLASPAAFAA